MKFHILDDSWYVSFVGTYVRYFDDIAFFSILTSSRVMTGHIFNIRYFLNCVNYYARMNVQVSST